MSHMTGFIDGVAYTAVIGDEDAQADPEVPSIGVVTGSIDVLALLRAHEGVEIDGRPGIPTFTLDTSDKTSVISALLCLTVVRDASADVYEVMDTDDVPAGAIV